MEEEGSGVIGPPCRGQKVHYKTKIETLVKKRKKKFNFDYTAGLVCEYGNKYNL